jgi:hypothetical protein
VGALAGAAAQRQQRELLPEGRDEHLAPSDASTRPEDAALAASSDLVAQLRALCLVDQQLL